MKENANIVHGSVRRRFLGGALWNFAGTALGRALYLGGLILAARLLGREDYGRLWAAYSMVLYFGSLVGGGFGVPATKLVAEHRGVRPGLAGAAAGRLLSAVALLGLAAAAMLWASAGWVAEKLLSAPEMAGTLRLAAVLFPIAAVQACQAGILAGTESFRHLALAAAIQGAVMVPMTAWLAGSHGLPGAVWALAAAGLAGCAVQHVLLVRECGRSGIRLSLSSLPNSVQDLWRPVFLLSASGLAAAAAIWMTNWMLASRPGGFGQMGLVNVGMQWMAAAMFLQSIMAQVGLPIIIERKEAKDKDGAHKTFMLNLVLNVLLSAPIMAAVITAQSLILDLYGPDFSDGGPVLLLMAWAGLAAGIGMPLANEMMARGAFGRYLAAVLAWAAALPLLFLVMLGQGALGLAWAHLLAGIMMLAALWATVKMKILHKGHDVITYL